MEKTQPLNITVMCARYGPDNKNVFPVIKSQSAYLMMEENTVALLGDTAAIKKQIKITARRIKFV
jgi:hypothetical protein